ncbi:MAG: DUF1887 family protein [Kiritimatiellae bacterium]|nr:DUF1887 family protein [Kiritimatiellia bacterium]
MGGRELDDLSRLATATSIPYRLDNVSESTLQILQDARLIRPVGSAGYVVEPSEWFTRLFYLRSPQESNAEFFRSGYIEVFVWSQLRRGGFDQVAWHVQLNPGQRGELMELDVVVERDARLMVVECKSGIRNDERVADLAEEQSAVVRKVGRAVGGWVLYIHQWRHTAGENISSQEARARSLGGALVWREDLYRLHEMVTQQIRAVRPLI